MQVHVTTIRGAARMLARRAHIAMHRALHRWRDFFSHQQQGATAIEYGLIAAGIAVVIIAVVNGIGANLSTTFGQVQTALTPAA
jgi:pilus assembly protein Flp/PilA